MHTYALTPSHTHAHASEYRRGIITTDTKQVGTLRWHACMPPYARKKATLPHTEHLGLCLGVAKHHDARHCYPKRQAKTHLFHELLCFMRDRAARQAKVGLPVFQIAILRQKLVLFRLGQGCWFATCPNIGITRHARRWFSKALEEACVYQITH
jgi:hypothetical protein